MAKTWLEATASPVGWSVGQARQAFDGSSSALAAAFAGVDRSQKGYYKDPAYKAAQRNLERWHAQQTQPFGPLPEGQKRSQARMISPGNQAKLDAIVQGKLRRDRPLPHLSIRGRILVNGSDVNRRPRQIEQPITWANVDRIARVAREKGEEAAWQEFSEWYGGNASYTPISVDIAIA